MSTVQLVTGDTAAGDTEARRTPQRGTSAGAAHVYVVNGADSGTDSNGNPLPADFSSWPSVVDESDPTEITDTRTLGGVTYIQTITVSGSTTSVSQWVKQ